MSLKTPKKVLKDGEFRSNPLGPGLYEFGPFRVDPRERQIHRDGAVVQVTAKAFDTLLLLIERSGHLVEKSEIMHAVWPDSFVEEGNLSVTVHMLRKALGDDSSEHKYIETLAKRGYRFVAKVREIYPDEAESIIQVANQPDTLVAAKNRPGVLIAYGRPMAFSALMVCALAVVAFHSWHVTKAGGKIQSLAVLPFRSTNPNAVPDDLGLAMADAISSRLGSTGQILTKPTSDLSKYAGASIDPLAIGHEQKVDAILSGSVEGLPDFVRVTAQLVRVSDGSVLWTDRFQESAGRMFALEEEVESGVARSMAIRLSKDSTSGPPKRESADFNAYKLYLEGRYFWNKRTEDGLRRSIEYFQQATTEDPQYAVAYAGLADSYSLLGSYGVEPAAQAYPNAKSAALKALELDSSLAEAHNSLGMISFYYEWDWKQAEREFKRSIDLNPEYALAHTWYGVNLAALGRKDEAVEQVQEAKELDPLSLIINTEVGRVFYLVRNYDQAKLAYRKVIDLEPQFARAHTRLGMTYAAEAKFRDAIREFEQAQQLSGADPYLDGLLGFAHARLGDTAEARRLLEKLTKRSEREYVPAYSMALICVGLDERDRAMELFSRAYADRSAYMVYAKTDPLLDSVRSDPRFAALLNMMKLS
jgi:DNA-binding winged helix-turn-helix (wHTH) protein/tetratricopeptide (TPR) repeat protein